ncbi:hypothetical protein CDL15_Pgr012119 [Punica granatum]|uniref:Uncharacterized protein n=1 Tax=Punica granatum TaxID=22663 RepID=A0A218XMG5_PUNGR|nr:hypothetical protein CDL15_Pgr012119 [Punica granatum]
MRAIWDLVEDMRAIWVRAVDIGVIQDRAVDMGAGAERRSSTARCRGTLSGTARSGLGRKGYRRTGSCSIASGKVGPGPDCISTAVSGTLELAGHPGPSASTISTLLTRHS